MKVGIITYHFVYNCGAVLQCLALQKVLRSLGHEPVVINYRPWYHQNRYTKIKNPFPYLKIEIEAGRGKKAALRSFGGAIKSWANYPRSSVNDNKFSRFRNAYLKQTRTYRSIRSLRSNPPQCEAYISGSDQLWNPYLTCGKPDVAYFLDFGSKETIRMTYAMGADLTELQKHRQIVSDLVKNFDAISLRENKCVPFIQSISTEGIKIHIDLDPTLLLHQADFEPYETQKVMLDKPFILTYTMPDTSADAVRHAARELGKQKGMPVIDIAMRRVKIDDEIFDPYIASPDEFLAYMHQAAYVFTNSFHGTAFSILYHKQFMTVPHRKTGNRVTEILDKLGLDGRWKTTGAECLPVIDQPIDYQAAEQIWDKLRMESIEYIKRILSKSQNN